MNLKNSLNYNLNYKMYKMIKKHPDKLLLTNKNKNMLFFSLDLHTIYSYN